MSHRESRSSTDTIVQHTSNDPQPSPEVEPAVPRATNTHATNTHAPPAAAAGPAPREPSPPPPATAALPQPAAATLAPLAVPPGHGHTLSGVLTDAVLMAPSPVPPRDDMLSPPGLAAPVIIPPDEWASSAKLAAATAGDGLAALEIPIVTVNGGALPPPQASAASAATVATQGPLLRGMEGSPTVTLGGTFRGGSASEAPEYASIARRLPSEDGPPRAAAPPEHTGYEVPALAGSGGAAGDALDPTTAFTGATPTAPAALTPTAQQQQGQQAQHAAGTLGRTPEEVLASFRDHVLRRDHAMAAAPHGTDHPSPAPVAPPSNPLQRPPQSGVAAGSAVASSTGGADSGRPSSGASASSSDLTETPRVGGDSRQGAPSAAVTAAGAGEASASAQQSTGASAAASHDQSQSRGLGSTDSGLRATADVGADGDESAADGGDDAPSRALRKAEKQARKDERARRRAERETRRAARSEAATTIATNPPGIDGGMSADSHPISSTTSINPLIAPVDLPARSATPNKDRPLRKELKSRSAPPPVADESNSFVDKSRHGDSGDLTAPNALQRTAPPIHSSSASGHRLLVRVQDGSPLEDDVNVTFPLVRVWVVDRDTGASYARFLVRSAQAGDAGSVAQPAFTCPFDVRRRGTTQPVWDEVVALDTDTPLAGIMSAVLLFEVLNLGSEDLRGYAQRGVAPDAATLVAWGYLSLHDATGATNSGRPLRVQLFRSPHVRGWLWTAALAVTQFTHPTPQAELAVGKAAKNDPHVPEIFHTFASRMNRCDPYCGTISVAFSHSTVAEVIPPSGRAQVYPYEIAMLRQCRRAVLGPTLAAAADAAGAAEVYGAPPGTSLGRSSATIPRMSMAGAAGGFMMALGVDLGRRRSGAAAGDAAATRRRRQHEALLRRDFRRKRGERCLPPNTTLHQFALLGVVTAVALHDRLLAVAVTHDFRSRVRLFDIFSPGPALVGDLAGHVDRIHALRFSPNGTYLVSAGADRTARVWDVSSMPRFVVSEADERTGCPYTLPHAAPVYGAELLGGSAALVTCGFESRLYLWSLQTGHLIATPPHPTGSGFFRQIEAPGQAYDTKLYALDSAGVLSTWRAQEDTATRTITGLVVRLRLALPGAVAMSVGGGKVAVRCDATASVRRPSVSIVDGTSLLVLQRIALPTGPRAGPSSFMAGGAGASAFGRGTGAETRHAPLARHNCFVLPDGLLIGYSDNAARIVAYTCPGGELFSAATGVAVEAPDPASETLGLTWSASHHICALISHDTSDHVAVGGEGRAFIVVAGRARAEGEEVPVTAGHSDVLRAMFGGDVTKRLRGPYGFATAGGAHGAGGHVGVSPRPPTFTLTSGPAAGVVSPPSIATAVGLGSGPGSPDGLLGEEPVADTAADRPGRIAQILGYWRGLVVSRASAGAGSTATHVVPPAAAAIVAPPSRRSHGSEDATEMHRLV